MVTAESLPVLSRRITRHPLYLPSRGAALFAWLHSPGGPAASHGVVLCPTVGHEQVHAHRGLRHLAEAFAAAGFPTLRFDYHGTGDSAGTEAQPERLATWVANVRDAASWLREQGCSQITLVGLRFGATLAALAATEKSVDALILWAPVVTGRAFVRELKTLSKMSGTSAELPESRGVEAGGFLLTPETAAEFGTVDLRTARPQCRRALIVMRDDVPEDTRLRDHFRSLGIEAEQTSQPGFPELLAEPHHTRVPEAAIAATVQWLAAGESPVADLDLTPEDSDREAIISPGEYESDGTSAIALRERGLFLDDASSLFGILTEPAEGPRLDTPTVLFVNGGSAYRAGPGRLYVHLTRALAARGYRCLRLDLLGLGDSVAPPGASENHPYPPTALRDVSRALAALRTQFGGTRVVLSGLCSGAFTAFQSAVHLPDPALVECVIINPLTFYWHEGMSLDVPLARHFSAMQYYLGAMVQPCRWLRLLRGRSAIGFAGLLRLLARHWGVGNRIPASATPAAGEAEDLPRDLDRATGLYRRRLSFLFARSDPGYRVLMHQARKPVRRLLRSGSLQVRFIEDADHTFARRASRTALVQSFADILRDRERLAGP